MLSIRGPHAQLLTAAAAPQTGLRVGVRVEVMVFRLLGEGGVGYRVVTAPMTSQDTDPDVVAMALSKADKKVASSHPASGSVCHSTSWRWVEGTVVLTYALTPDPCPDLSATALVAPSVLCSGDPMRPTPHHLHEHHIAAHALRHLDYLAASDPTIRQTAKHHADLWAAIHTTAAAMPVGTYNQIHDRPAR